jgi:2-polyprenyl-3-methyl-5-hydroxy-6-metoxy-1,4-benzoquinol methylase
MPHDAIDFRRRAQLTELMDEPCSRDQLRACLRDIARLNRWSFGYRPLLNWLATLAPRTDRPLRILDVGCGYGDSLRRVARWAAARGINVELTGLDINHDTVAIATEADPECRIAWTRADIFAYEPAEPFHVVVSSLFTHHLEDAEVIRFLGWMERHASAGWFVNDLFRSAVPYHFLRVLTRVMHLHRFVQNDGPVSIARSFTPEDWKSLCAAAGFSNGDVTIRPYKPARLCVARSKMP